MTTKKNLVKLALMSTLTAGTTFAFTACSDDIQMEDIQQMAEMENSGLTRAEAEGYNVNDFHVNYDGTSKASPFTYKDWRDHQSIFIYNGGSNTIEVNTPDGIKKKTGFNLVQLPNGKRIGENANLPASAWNEVWADGSDWELAFNTCGYDQLEHGSYLGFYNKYKGIVRVFAYIDGEATSNASDHLWAIQMDDDLAQHSTFRYGVPMDRKIVDKVAIGQNGEEMAQVTTPWGSSSAIQGAQQPSKGWWAFDIDLSVYRGANAKRISDYMGSDTDLLKLRCLGITKSDVELYGDLRGQAKGTIDLEKTSVSSSSGIFGCIEDVLGKANGIKELYDLGSKLMNPNPLEAINTGVELAKKGCDLFGVDYGATKSGKDGYKGEISMDLTAEINTTGYISSSTPVNGNASPSLKGNAFLVNSENCSTLGEGVWNIKNTPKMYIVDNFRVNWKRQDNDLGNNLNNIAYPWYYSPFGGAANVYPNEWNYMADTKPFQGKICVFDPSSIEVELNPNIFPEGTTYQVSAVCGVRKGMKFGSTEDYRKAQGLKGSQTSFNKVISISEYNDNVISDRPVTEAPFDGLYGFNSKDIPSGYKTGTKFDQETCNDHKVGVFGRGDSEFLVEPMALAGGKDKDDWSFYMLPAYEVTVTVTVEHNGRTFMYSRTYLPEYEDCKKENLKNVYDKAKKADKTHYTAMYDSQVARIQKIQEWIDRTPVCQDAIQTKWETTFSHGWSKEEEAGYALLDGDISKCWYSSEDSRNSVWFHDNKSKVGGWTCAWVEFDTYAYNKVKGFTLTGSKYKGKCPKQIRLLAWEDGKWREIYFEDNFNKRFNDQYGATTVCKIPVDKQKAYKDFRFECSHQSGAYSFAELTLNY